MVNLQKKQAGMKRLSEGQYFVTFCNGAEAVFSNPYVAAMLLWEEAQLRILQKVTKMALRKK